MKNIWNFSKRTGIIESAVWFWNNGFTLVDGGIGIAGEDVETIRQFCALNPSFHMVSFSYDDMLYNKYIPDQLMYFLADGDADTTLEAKFVAFPSEESRLNAAKNIAEQIDYIRSTGDCLSVEEIFPPRIYH